MLDNTCVDSALPGCVQFDVSFPGPPSEPRFTCVKCQEEYFLSNGRCGQGVDGCTDTRFHTAFAQYQNLAAMECAQCRNGTHATKHFYDSDTFRSPLNNCVEVFSPVSQIIDNPDNFIPMESIPESTPGVSLSESAQQLDSLGSEIRFPNR